MQRLIRRFLFAFFLVCISAIAQTSLATVRGTVADPTGAVVVAADISLTNVETNLKRATKTNENGDFEIPDLLRGTYRLTATSAGFKNFVADNIILETGQIRRINATLELGAVGSEVTVQANAAVISTDTAKIQGQFTNERFDETPLIGDGRNPGLILSTLPNVQTAGSIYANQFAGQGGAQIQEGIDGHTSDGVVNQISEIAYIQEVVTVTVNNSAEYSRVGYINMITKSGSNNFHGRGAYYHRNSVWEAKDYFAAKKPVTRVHDVYADFNGPIKKNKTFFFVGYKLQMWPASTFYLRDVPTLQMRNGDFSQLLAAAKPIAIKDPLSGAPFPGNIIPASRFNSVSSKVQEKYLPAPNLGGPNSLSSNYGFVWPYPGDLWHGSDFMVRIDHQFSEKNRIYGRLMTGLVPFGSYYVLPANYPSLAWTRARNSAHVVVEDTHIFSPVLVNTFRFGLYREGVADGGTVNGFTPFKGDQVVKELGIQGVNPQGLSAAGFPRMDIAGYPTITDNPGGILGIDHDWAYGDSVTWSKGRHVLKFGAEFKPYSKFVGVVPEGNYGIFNYNGSMTGYGQADFLLGLPYSSQRLNPLTNRTQLDSEFGVYAMDSFKVNSRLTLDYGLRWERFGAATYNDGLIYNWDPATGNVIIPPEGVKSVSPLYPVNTIKVVSGPAKQQPSWKNFAPRVGVAYRIQDNLVIRGGYGMFTETLGRYARALSGGPYQISETFYNSIQNGQPLFAMPNPFPAGAGSIPSQSISGYPLSTDNGHIHQFNLTIERQIHDVGFRVSYLGSRSRGLNYSVGLNSPPPSLIPFSQSRRPYPQFVGASWTQNDGMANYNALGFEVQKKVGSLTFDNHWTWASNYSNNPNTLYPYGPKGWTRDTYSPRQRLVFNTIWQLPVGHGRRFLGSAPGVADAVLGGWQLYWVAFFETGSFFSPTFSGSDPSNTNSFGGRPDRICNGNLPAGQRTLRRWFDASCFAVPVAGTFGNSGNNVLEGPGLNEHNLTFLKKFHLYERLSLTYMASITNLFNHPNFSTPSANISVPGSVGVISSTKSYAPNRQMVMRIRLDF